MAEKIYDVTIVGGGPVGIYGAFYAGMQGMTTMLVDALPELGGQLAALYPEKYIYDLPGHSKIRANEIIEKLIGQLESYKEKISLSLNTTIQTIEKLEDGTFKISSDKAIFYSRSIIITAGNGAFKPRMLEGDEGQYKNIHYFVSQMDKFKDKKVVIFGGGDSAVDWALMLEEVAQKVTLVHRREEFRAHESSAEKLKQSKVEIMTPYIVEKLMAKQEDVKEVSLKNVKNEELKVIEADEIIVLFGFISSLGPIKNWELELDKNAIRVDYRQQTNITGVYAAGDVCTFDGKIKMITAGFGEVVVAINAAKSYAFPDKVHHHKHSSTLIK